MNLLINAIESIKVGVEDYQEGSHARLLASVRSIHAGVLLLYKEALRRWSPPDSDEVLMKTRILPRRNAKGIVQFVGEGTKTVDVQQVKERFAALGIATDWTRFDRITNVRNEIEHYSLMRTREPWKALSQMPTSLCEISSQPYLSKTP